jgi:predicted 3-demethylubiquinone-9 3-methyltransferase (glyoxalase superfamily)
MRRGASFQVKSQAMTVVMSKGNENKVIDAHKQMKKSYSEALTARRFLVDC